MIFLRAVAKTYPDGKCVLRDVEFNLESGIVGILGKNGAGKSTLLSILVLLLEPTSGECFYWGMKPGRWSARRKIRQEIGYLPQDFMPAPSLTGAEYLRYCARVRGVRVAGAQLETWIRQLLEAVFLEDAADRSAGTYSGGMRRRLGIAQALIHKPKVVVVDEPTAGLDPEERIRFRNLISEVGEDRAVLLSTHIVEDLEATCSRIAILSGGRISFNGRPEDLIRDMRALGPLPAGSPLEGAYSRFVERDEVQRTQ